MKIFHRIVIPAAALGMVAFGCNAVMAKGTTDKVSKLETQHFIDEAAHANDSEIAEARYALEHSQSPEVKQFANKMIDDHTKADQQLMQIASNDGYKMPTGVSVKERASMKMMEKHHGAAFDEAYSKSQPSDHRKVIAMFKRATKNPHIASDVRNYAQMTLPVLEDHLNMATKLVASVGGTRKAG